MLPTFPGLFLILDHLGPSGPFRQYQNFLTKCKLCCVILRLEKVLGEVFMLQDRLLQGVLLHLLRRLLDDSGVKSGLDGSRRRS